MVLFYALTLQAQPTNVLRDSVRIAPALRVAKGVSDVLLKVNNPDAFLAWRNNHRTGLGVEQLGEGIYAVTGLTDEFWKELKQAPGVTFIDRGNRVAKEETVLGDFDQSGNAVTSIRYHFPLLTGEGLVLSVKEKPFDINDLDVRGRVVLNDQFDEPATFHATFMATIAAGAGNTSPYAQGAAWGAGITTADFARLLPDDGNGLTALGVSVQNHSYGVGLENYYGIESSEYDRKAKDFSKILHVFSSGNEGGRTPTEGSYAGLAGVANLTGQFKVSKNTLAVGSSDRYGNVVAGSSRGPAHDGRVKPELLAFGDGGASESAAVVSGIAVLVQQAYKNKFNDLPDAALVKAVLINSAQDTGRPNVDFETGFGNADALGALRIVEEEKIFSGVVNQDDEAFFQIEVPTGEQLLKVTLVWADPPADPFVTKTLINDLDLIVRHTGTNETFEPWVLDADPSLTSLQQPGQRGKDRLNNVEQVTISFPEAGMYQIQVGGYAVPQGPQEFYIAHETFSGFEWRYPLETDALTSDASAILRWQWHGAPETGRLAYRLSSEEDWNLITTQLELEKNYFEWMTPNTSGLIQFKITLGDDDHESGMIALSKPDRLKVGFICEDELMLVWNRVEAADKYGLYLLHEKYLEPFLITTDTFALVQIDPLLTNFFSVVPVIQNRKGAREFTIDYTAQGVGCYFISFIPHAYVVTDKAGFTVSLGTTFGLQSAVLERRVGSAFVPVETYLPVPSTLFTVEDASPVAGIQYYRLKLVTDDQRVIVSNEEPIFFVRETDVHVYPNPVVSGNWVNVIIYDQESTLLQLTDIYGRVIREAEEFGSVKTINTETLVAGTYLLKIRTGDGLTRFKKLIVRQ
jgi:hypothetical protein